MELYLYYYYSEYEKHEPKLKLRGVFSSKEKLINYLNIVRQDFYKECQKARIYFDYTPYYFSEYIHNHAYGFDLFVMRVESDIIIDFKGLNDYIFTDWSGDPKKVHGKWTWKLDDFLYKERNNIWLPSDEENKKYIADVKKYYETERELKKEIKEKIERETYEELKKKYG